MLFKKLIWCIIAMLWSPFEVIYELFTQVRSKIALYIIKQLIH